ncbi:MAG: serine/threonine-protein kinase [Byssovorax sp.]
MADTTVAYCLLCGRAVPANTPLPRLCAGCTGLGHRAPSGPPPAPAIPGYEGLSRLAEGGMGVVFSARRIADGVPAAIKVLRHDLWKSRPMAEDFLTEIRLLGELRHPGIVALYEAGPLPDGLYYAMELCEEGSVAARVSRAGPLSWAEAKPLVHEALEALSFIHERAVVHRDIKPQNLLLRAGGAVKIADLGLARSFRDATYRRTATGAPALGTWRFMPAEQLADYKHVRPATDQWAMAATIRWMLTGRGPRDIPDGAGEPEVLAIIEDPSSILPLGEHRAGLPPRVAAALDRALAFDPNDRFPTTRALLAALKEA